MSDTLFKWVKASDELPDKVGWYHIIQTLLFDDGRESSLYRGGAFWNGYYFNEETDNNNFQWLKPVSDEIENLKKQLGEQIASAAMNEQSLLELNRKIKENTLDKVIEWCDKKLLETKEEISKGWRGEDLNLLIQRRTDLNQMKYFVQSLK